MRNDINGTERSEPGGEPVPSSAGAQILIVAADNLIGINRGLSLVL